MFVGIASSNTSYIDDAFYVREEMEILGAHKACPVTFHLVEIGWLINTEDGENFMKDLVTTPD